MKYTSYLATGLMLLGGLAPVSVRAMDCYVDPVYAYTGSGTIRSAVFVRDQACSTGSSILLTLSAGTGVQVIGFTDGWYYVEVNGARGWVGQTFVNTNAQQSGASWPAYQEYMVAYPSKSGASPAPAAPKTTDPTFMARVKGYILLQTQQHGEAWYVDPITQKRYYMKDGQVAYQMMRSFGLGISETDFASMQTGAGTMKSRLRGRIVLRAQAHGEAYYIHPKDLMLYYLRDGDEAYRIMRLYSLGISDIDLGKVVAAEIPMK